MTLDGGTILHYAMQPYFVKSLSASRRKNFINGKIDAHEWYPMM